MTRGQRLVLLWLATLWAGAIAVRAQLPDALKQKLTLTSISGQFVVHADRDPTTGVAKQAAPGEAFTYNVGVSGPLTLFALRQGGSTNVIEVDPKMLAISCERVKKAVLSDLGLADKWRGQVHVFVAPAGKRYQAVDILPERYGDGWQFRMGVPAECDWQRLVRGIVEVVLLELANRNTRANVAQAPLWLSEGLSGLIIAEHGRTLVTEPNAFLVVAGRKLERLRQARELFRDGDPATFTELSLPDPQKLGEPVAWSRYQAAAQLFTQEILNDGDGRQRLGVFLQILPQNLNWQTAFLRAFNPHFLTLMDVERWWAVAVADFQSRDPRLEWSREKVVRQLAGVMRENAEMQAGTNGPVTRQEVALSQIVATWEFPAQREVLQRKATQLQTLHLHAPADLKPLVAECFRAVDGYLYQRVRFVGDRDSRGDVGTRARMVSRDASRQLARLESRVTALQPGAK